MGEGSIGNQLNQIINYAKSDLFNQGELAQLSYNAFEHIVDTIQKGTEEEIKLSFPVGYLPNKTPILSDRKYKKTELIERYAFLANTKLSINGIYQLVTIVEAMLSDVIRAIIIKYPKKAGTKKNINLSIVLSASSIEEIHLRAIDSILNELSYKSPSDFAETIKDIISLNLLECPSFHKYVEIKATRDIYIHNRGVVNEIYNIKAGSHARARVNYILPVDTQYFLESYETCLQFTEWLELNLNDIWSSSEFEDRKLLLQNKNTQVAQPVNQPDTN